MAVYKLSEICTKIGSGATPRGGKESYSEKGISLIRSQNVLDYKFSYDGLAHITEEQAEKLNNVEVRSNDVLLNITGDSVARACKVVSSVLPARVNQHVAIVRANEDVALSSYILYYLQLSKKNLLLLASGGATRNALTKEMIENLQISIPSIERQEKIVAIIDNLQDKIELNNRISENLEQQAASYYYHLFVENADPSWREGTISDLGTVVGGSTPSKAKPEYYTDDGIAWITPKDLSVDKSKFITHGADDITELGLRNSSATIMPAGTVLFSSRAPIGYIAIADGEVTTNQGFKSVVPYENIGTAFMFYFLKNALPTIENMASGSTFKEISGSTMRTVPAIIPDDDTLHKFSSFCEPLFQQQRALEAENRTLATLRDSLLPRLMSGELDVSDIAI